MDRALTHSRLDLSPLLSYLSSPICPLPSSLTDCLSVSSHPRLGAAERCSGGEPGPCGEPCRRRWTQGFEELQDASSTPVPTPSIGHLLACACLCIWKAVATAAATTTPALLPLFRQKETALLWHAAWPARTRRLQKIFLLAPVCASVQAQQHHTVHRVHTHV